MKTIEIKLPEFDLQINYSRFNRNQIVKYDLHLNYLNGVVVENSKYFTSKSGGSISNGYGDINTWHDELDQFFLLDVTNAEHSFRVWNLSLEMRNSHVLTVILDPNGKVLAVLNHSIRKKFIYINRFRDCFNINAKYPEGLIIDNIKFEEFE
jgi:WD40 repeat protein